LTIPRLYVPQPLMQEERIALSDREHHYLSRVLRMRKGEEVKLLDGAGLVAKGRIVSMSASESVIEVSGREQSGEEIPRLELFQAMLPPAKMDRVVQDCSEAGVAALTPFSCERSRRIDDNVGERMQRWRRVAIEAWRLSGRPYMPEVREPLPWESFLNRLDDSEGVLFADEAGGRKPGEALKAKSPQRVVLIIGPEGGFSNKERDRLEMAGARPVTLGKGIFRAETAGLVLIVAVRCHYGFI
jgi:16S rRNA (uracil1498-N3)-methyltransferase